MSFRRALFEDSDNLVSEALGDRPVVATNRYRGPIDSVGDALAVERDHGTRSLDYLLNP
jgi:hypothetical protein